MVLFLKRLLDRFPKRRLFIDCLNMIVWTILNCFYITLLSKMTTNVLEGRGNLALTALGYFGFILIWELNEGCADYCMFTTEAYIENITNYVNYEKAYKTKASVLKRANTGYITGLISKLIDRRRTAYTESILFGIMAVVYIMYFVVRMWVFHWAFGLALLIVVSVAVIYQIISNKWVAKWDAKLSKAESKRTKLFVDAVANISTVQKMKADEFMKSEMSKIMEECASLTRKWSITSEISLCVFKLLNYTYAPVCLLLIGVFDFSSEVNILEFLPMVGIVGIQMVHISKSIASMIKSMERFNVAYDTLAVILSPENEKCFNLVKDFETAEIKDVSYTYEDTANSCQVTVSIPDFKVNKGDKICIYGESGQGKTTTLNILSGEIETQGVFINGVLTTDRLDTVYVGQDVEMLDMSLRNNLKLGNENISDEALLELISATGLDNWYSKQEKGLDTILGERGTFVSTGQRQRLNLIRGLLIQDGEVYLLDEPVSNVDKETEEKLINLIAERLKDKTLIVVSHQPSIMRICNRRYKFVDGVCREEV